MPIVVWLKEREPRNTALRERLAGAKAAGLTRSQAESLSLSGAPSSTRVAGSAASVPAPDAAAPAAGGAPGTATPTTAIPPRPRKKGKRR